MRETASVPTPTTTSPTLPASAYPAPTPDTDARPPSEQVVAAVAAVAHVDPTEMEPLYRVVDPDCLDGLFGGPDSDAAAGRVTFTFAGCDVVVRNDATVAVTPHDADDPALDTAVDPVPPLRHRPSD